MIYKTILASLTALIIAAASSFAQDSHKSGPFQGAKANTGYVTHTTESGNSVLRLPILPIRIGRSSIRKGTLICCRNCRSKATR